MSDAFIGEIRVVGFNFAPKGWALCNGQLMPLSQNTALFALLGTQFGGDGKSTFALPDLQGRAPMKFGQGPGLSERFMGENGGVPSLTLTQLEMPLHNHTMHANGNAGDLQIPTSNRTFARTAPGFAWGTTPSDSTFAPEALAVTGGSQPHENRQPFLALNFVIALQGIFPSRS